MAICAGLAAASVGYADEGLKPGDAVGAFHVKDITGEHASEDECCYRCMYGNKPVVAVFARGEMDDKLAKACKDLEKKLSEKKIKSFVVYMTDDVAAATPKIKEFAKKHELKNLPLTAYKGVSGPENYKLCKECDVALVMWNQGKVVKTKTYAKGEFCNDCCGQQVASFEKTLSSDKPVAN
jgi:hypothetical protein